MKAFHILKLLIRLTSLALLICCSLQKGIGQKNTLKFTPLKTLENKANLGFERQLSDQYSIILDVQFWYLYRKKHTRETVFGPDEYPVLESNKGTRFNLELRRYMTIHEKGLNKINFYLGVGGFLGPHKISMIRERYSLPLQWGGSIDVPELLGDVNLISLGAYANPGVQFALGKVFKCEFGVLLGKAWVDQQNDYLTIYSYEPYILEEDRVRFKQNYSNRLAGFFMEPMFNIGFSF